MPTGAITEYVDVAQLVLYAFWIFFIGLIIYLRREDKREGYPLESDRSDRITVQGFPAIPEPKTFRLADGRTVSAPSGVADTRPVHATPSGNFGGAPLVPTGDPMADGVGPAAWANRHDAPDMTLEGEVKIVPLRIAHGFSIPAGTIDPRGMDVVGADGAVAGTVSDVWPDRSETIVRYLEVDLAQGIGSRRVLVPMTLAKVDRVRRRVHVESILARQFAGVPATASAERITLREEDRISAYFASGHLYATPRREGPII
jgi:photosynthetic reaction center H subunit